METYFQGFHEDENFSSNLLLSNSYEVVKDETLGMENIKMEESASWDEESIESQHLVGKEDFQQIMSDWQQHIGSLQSTDNEDLGLGLDTNLDILNTYSSSDLFSEVESPILSNALKYPGQKCAISVHQLPKSLATNMCRDSFLENLGSNNETSDCNQKFYGLIKTEPNVIRKVTLINGEKEILGKNIIGLHCLNEIRENPDENCQVTSTVINGKRYKIIIKPKSLKVKKLSEEKIRKTLIKKLMQCHIVTKTEPKDEIISEMCNGNYDVPILNSDLLPSWDFAALDFDSTQVSNDIDSTIKEIEPEPEKKVSALRVKIPKIKKHKKIFSLKSDDEINLESINEQEVEGHTLGMLLKNFDEKVGIIEKNNSENEIDQERLFKGNDKTEKQTPSISSENIKNSLPREMIDRIEALKRKKKCRIPLIQAIPTKKATKNGTRMQDAVATMNRNKLLKIVSGGDSVQMDHDYCSTFTQTSVSNKHSNKSVCLEVNLAEKNPKKDSGMESGDVSDASEGPNTPDSIQNIQFLRQISNKVLEEHLRVGNYSSVSKAAIAFFRASNSASVNANTNSSDSVKTKTVSNGNKALTNSIKKSDRYSFSNNTVSSDHSVENDKGNQKVGGEEQKTIGNSTEQNSISQNERPKKKLKLEEYLNRRHLKEKEKEKEESNICCKSIEGSDQVYKETLIKSVENGEAKVKKIFGESQAETSPVVPNTNNSDKNTKRNEDKNRKYWRDRNRRSSSASSGERCKRARRRSRSKSGCHRRRSNSNGSNGRRRERRGKHKYRQSESREGKSRKGFWSGSLSRSSSRESSTSSDHSGNRNRRSSLSRYHRRSRSRSVSRGRSRSRNRGFKRFHPGSYYYNRNFNNRRSKSPFYAYSMREKQRQIEERRVIYIGRIEEGMTNAKLRERFSIFGPIIDISLHFREYGDNYGFVTYAYKADAYDAVEHGNDDPSLPHYDLCFGGRRGFCKEKYADLDGMPTSYSGFNDNPFIQNTKDSFDLLLKEAQAKLKNRKK